MSVQLLFLLGFLLCSIPPSSSESSTCLMVYKEGGAPAVYKSPKCSRWTLLADDIYRPMENCQSAMLQGRRRSQEDRTVCALDIQIPFLGRTGVEEISVGIIAVFDGHNGAEASDMASKLLLEYFLLHVYFLLDGIYSAVLKRSTERLTNKGEHDAIYQVFNLDKGHSWHNLDQERSKWMFPTVFDRPFHMEILKESLLRTIHDIDAAFSKDAFRKNLESGSTASVVLVADGQILAANVGDSKALLCSENFHHGNLSKLNRRRRHKYAISSGKESNSGGPTYCVKELTEDHHPDRNDERNRVEAAGGHVVDWAGVPRVNGELAVSRAIGDVSFKSYGVISIPEVTDWQSLTSNDTYLVAATDGIFEKMTTQEVCDLLWDANIRDDVNSEFISDFTRSLADCIVNTAFERGSMDNMAAVVVPLRSTGISGTLTKDRCDLERNSGSSLYGLQNHMYIKSANVAIATSLIPMEYQNRIMSKFTRLLVETKNKRLGCFYLSENLNEDMDYVFQAPRDHQEDEVHDFSHSLSEPLGYYHSVGPLDLYSDQNLCWHFGMHNEDDRGHCTSPEVFAKFLGLLDSVSYDETSSNSSESFGQKIPNFRYTLKRRFDRGSYGEVWLAFHWNCSQDGDTLNQMHKNTTCFATHLHIDPSECNTSINSSSKQWFTDAGDDSLFILKRIMVERGNTAYLSGLREKYFGEIFLNASMSLGGLAAAGLSTAFSRESQLDASDLSEMNKSDLYGMGYVLNPTNTFPRNFRKLTASYEEGLKHIARYVESFESQSKEIWLVFRNEGLSLSKLIYTAEETKLNTSYEKNERVNNIQVLHPSAWWHWLRTTPAGKTEMRNLIWQLLTALKSCHDRNITHRDIKPENMIICFEDVDTGRCLRGIPSGEKHYPLKMRVIDFGSAIDEHSMKYLYGSGPSRSEQTFEYSPPEALLNASWFHGPKRVTLKYDMWSVGVVMLELILGSPHVFQISDRTRALLDQHLEGWSEHTKELAYKLRSYMEMCILIPGISPLHHQSSRNKDNDAVWPASWKCSEESFSNQVKSRDPLKLGFPSVWALRLVRQLLVWHPEDRLSVDDALQHPYFQPHPQT